MITVLLFPFKTTPLNGIPYTGEYYVCCWNTKGEGHKISRNSRLCGFLWLFLWKFDQHEHAARILPSHSINVSLRCTIVHVYIFQDNHSVNIVFTCIEQWVNNLFSRNVSKRVNSRKWPLNILNSLNCAWIICTIWNVTGSLSEMFLNCLISLKCQEQSEIFLRNLNNLQFEESEMSFNRLNR